MALRFDSKFGQLEIGPDAATVAAVAQGAASDGVKLLPYYLMAVAAGVTVWFVTRWLGRKA